MRNEKEGKKIINSLPENAKKDLLQYLACYYSYNQLNHTKISNTIYEGYISSTSNKIVGFMQALKSCNIITENEFLTLVNFFNELEFNYKHLIAFTDNIIVYENLLNYFK